jgi:nucleotide-binding universal stress UspA family protein
VIRTTAASPKVLVAWDGSLGAATALPVAKLVAGQLGAEVEVLYVATDAQDREERGSLLLREAERLGFGLRLATGDAANEIVRWTEEPGIVLVALTTHGRELEVAYRLGGVAGRIVARTTRPVLIVKPESAGTVRGLKRLLVPVDGTPKTAVALRPVMELAAALEAAIDLLYVADPDQKAPEERGTVTAPRYVDQPQHEWPEWAAEVVHRLAACCAGCPEGVPVRIFLAQGQVGDEIARFAMDNQEDAIVLVRRSRFQPERAKVIRSVLRQTSCLVIIVGGEET